MKKKGLIISTVVMVMVLVAALSTATFAWFSSTAKATVDDLKIETTASEGLQIAMVNDDVKKGSYFSNELTYNGQWSGDVNTWGSRLGFTNITIGNMQNAVRQFKTGETVATTIGTLPLPITGYSATAGPATGVGAITGDISYIAKPVTIDAGTNKFQYGNHYKPSVAAVVAGTTFTKAKSANIGDVLYTIAKAKAGDPTAVGDVVCTATTGVWLDTLRTEGYVEKTSGVTLIKDLFLVPTSYDAAIQPLAYEIATANSEFYSLTMAVTNSKDIAELGFSVQIAPTGTTSIGAINADKPGMAAATRMQIVSSKANADGSRISPEPAAIVEEPFGKFHLNVGPGTMDKTTNAGTLNEDGKYAYLLGAKGGATIAASSVYYVTMLLWVEGTDNECDNKTAGTGMTFSIKFAYDETQAINWATADLLGTTWAGTAKTLTVA